MLGAWLAAASPAAVFAEPPSTVGRASVVDDSSSRTAVDRWRRLKSLYPIQEPPAPAATRSSNVPRAAKIEAPVRPIPDEPTADSERLAPESNSTIADPAPSRSASEAIESSLSSPPPRPALPIAPVDEEPAWVLPVVVEPEPEPDFKFDEADDGGVHALEPTHIVPAPVEESAALARESASHQSASSAWPSTKQVSHAQIAPVRYRPIDRINPFRDWTADGRESDNDIREFAKGESDKLNLAFGGEPFPERAFPATVKPWDAPNFFNYPLYFEDPALERYGHTRRPLIQPVVSIGRFSAQLVCLPYLMTLDPPCREVYSLGWYRPGECAPKLHYQVPLNAKAAAVQAATVTGLVFLIP
ncbi:MAG: hypothetical protein AABP62_13490 [Planctomycetota bacterium]